MGNNYGILNNKFASEFEEKSIAMKNKSVFALLPSDEEMNRWFDLFEKRTDISLPFDKEEEDYDEGDKINLEEVKETQNSGAFDELMGLVGLDNIKAAVRREISYHHIMEIRRNAGRRVPKRIMHLLLTGNPGSGKTTVAKLIGRIYKEEGILKNDVFIETNRAGLVGQYIGESEHHTRQLLEKAKGGILFIDEIYSLSDNADGGGTRDFGRRVVDTLIPVLSNPDSDVMVIGAGYPKEMKQFLEMNSGLASRFPTVLEFKDFTTGQLMEIARLQLSKYDFVFSEKAEERFRELLEKCARNSNCGNARMVVTTIENFVIPRLCMRIDESNLESMDMDEMSKILEEDIPMFEEVIVAMKQDTKLPHAGFRLKY